jgi:frataxin-like iron-binding protein CyaY
MATEKETWGDYSKLVLKELERLNDNYEKMREDIDIRFKEMNNVLSDFKNTEKIVTDQKSWIEKVNDVWSPVQMKEAKDEIYSQKNKWVATIAVFAFIEILIGIALAVWGKF